MADDGDRVICHACGGVWLLETGEDGRDNSLKCPHCESDFTEIVSDD
jgi:Zn finger protein HypA/HybF involved in hydrogenase expression